MSRARTTGKVWKVTRAESPRCLATGKIAKQGPHSQGYLPSPSILQVMSLRCPDLSYCRSCSSDPPLTFLPWHINSHVVHLLKEEQADGRDLLLAPGYFKARGLSIVTHGILLEVLFFGIFLGLLFIYSPLHIILTYSFSKTSNLWSVGSNIISGKCPRLSESCFPYF